MNYKEAMSKAAGRLEGLEEIIATQASKKTTDQIISTVYRMEGQKLKDWTNTIAAAAVTNGKAKTQALFLNEVYKELREVEALYNVNHMLIVWLIGERNHLQFIAAYQPPKELAIDFAILKFYFVKYIVVKAGV